MQRWARALSMLAQENSILSKHRPPGALRQDGMDRKNESGKRKNKERCQLSFSSPAALSLFIHSRWFQAVTVHVTALSCSCQQNFYPLRLFPKSFPCASVCESLWPHFPKQLSPSILRGYSGCSKQPSFKTNRDKLSHTLPYF